MSEHDHDGSHADCVGCAAVTRRLDAVRAAMKLDERLDDVTRARIWSRLDERLAAREGGEARSWRLWAAAFACAAVGAAALGLASRSSVGEGGGAGGGVVAGHAAAIVTTAPPQVAIAAAGSGSASVAMDRPTLVAPDGGSLTTPLGPHTRARLIGPARLAMIGAAGDATTVELDSGTLYASFDGGAGRSLRIAAPGMVVDVVGTLFAVEAMAGTTCVSVAHGRVRVTMGVRVAYVGGGERVCTDDGRTAPIDPAVRDALAQHEAGAPKAASKRGAAALAPIEPARVETAGAAVASGAATAAGSAAAGSASPPPPSADEDYAVAEDALARGDADDADRALAKLLTTTPSSPLADQALYERARIAYDHRAWADARRDLDALIAMPGSPLVEAGRYLSCRVDVEARDTDAARCLTAFRAAYPRSPHDLDVLGLLAQLAAGDGGCDAARRYVDELAAKHADAPLTKAWRARCP